MGPAVWRRFVVPSEAKLPKFNRMLETVMGWEGYHLLDWVGAGFDPDAFDQTAVTARLRQVR